MIPLVGCPYESTTPLTPAAEATLDLRLLGRWQAVGGEAGGREVEILPFNRHELLVIIRGPKGVDRYRGFTSRLDGDRYLNVDKLEPGETNERYYFVRYHIHGGLLDVEIVDDHLLAGTTGGGALGAALRHNRHTPGLFRPLGNLVKVTDAAQERGVVADLPDQIVYRFTDAPVPPEGHRSYTLTVTAGQVAVVVESYGTVVARRDRPLAAGELDRLLTLFDDCRIRHLDRSEDPGCTGGTRESLTIQRAGEAFTGTLDHCGGQESGTLGGDVGRFAEALRRLIPDFATLLRS